jgi:hypothetical protein
MVQPRKVGEVATVYHYKDTQAFKGVIENAALWATDFRYLNDSVACFTGLPDEITQWSGYGDKGRGVALGFDSERIRTLKVPQ